MKKIMNHEKERKEKQSREKEGRIMNEKGGPVLGIQKHG